VTTKTILTRKAITSRTVKRFFVHQSESGAFSLNEKTAGFYGFETSDAFSVSLKKYFVSERVKKVDHQVWVTAVTLWYWRLVAVDYKHDWVERYDRAYAWLKLHLQNDAQLEREILESAKKFVIERYAVEKEVFAIDESFASAQKEKVEVLEKVRKEEEKRLAKTKIGKSLRNLREYDTYGTFHSSLALLLQIRRLRSHALKSARPLFSNISHVITKMATSRLITNSPNSLRSTRHTRSKQVFEVTSSLSVFPSLISAL